MSPITPEMLGRGGYMTEGRNCARCGYSLRGLRAGARCPECGQPAAAAGRKRFVGSLTDAPIAYLRVLATGAWLMALGSLGSTLAVFAALGLAAAGAPAQSGAICGAVWVLCAAGWWGGVWIVTAPRQGGLPPAEAAEEWRVLRRVNRGLQAGWAIGGGLVMLASRSPAPFDDYLGYSGLAACLAAIIGVVPLCVQLADLAAWAQETGLADRFRVAAWGLTLFGTVTALAVPVGLATRNLSGAVSLALLAMNGITVLSVGLFFVCLVSLARMCTWAISNARNKMDRDRRLMERVAREAERMKE